MHATTVNMHQLDFKRKILDVVFTDQHCPWEKESLQQGDVQQKMKEYEMKEYGLLM
jgi:hypothetical protein